MRPRNQRDASLAQLAAAIIGSVAAAQDARPRCRDPHCPDFGRPTEATCPAEHAEAWRFNFPAGPS